MATDPANGLNYYLCLPAEYKSALAQIRSWSALGLGYDADQIWIKGLDYVQINSVEIKRIPGKSIFYEQEGRLFLLHSQLPNRRVPSLLWTPITRALPIKLPAFNHNYFGIHSKINIRLVASEMETEACAMITTTTALKSYLITAPALRLQQLKWVILDKGEVMITGKPLLPLSGEVYWQRGDFFIPAGYDLELYSLLALLNEQINPEKNNWVIWNKDGSYLLLEKNEMRDLTLGSFNLSVQQAKLSVA